MGVKGGAAYCHPSQGFTHTVKSICTRLNGKFPAGGPHNPVVSVDLLCWLIAALQHKPAVQQFFMERKVPVTHIVNYIFEHGGLLIRNGFVVLLIFDGASNPTKKATNNDKSSVVTDAKEKIKQIYSNPKKNNLGKLSKLQQTAVEVQKGVLYE
ncbi:unnamed protein product [Cylindrotheca closterium]|uniref:Uncharacterized protein n=1 Tax=Cylindrotheca closterium TaxID=2856 RepID=A0AAD2CHI9_9STRA|nr:unnamed protein product [Cylindrotheca closterium]